MLDTIFYVVNAMVFFLNGYIAMVSTTTRMADQKSGTEASLTRLVAAHRRSEYSNLFFGIVLGFDACYFIVNYLG